MKKPPPSPQTLREQQRERMQRHAIRLLRRTKRMADNAGVDLSTWEDEFLGSVEARIKTYGRAFADPEKGGRGSPFSALESVKLRQISAKAKGEKGKPSERKR